MELDARLEESFLINGQSGDPGLYVSFRNAARAVMFDCGDTSALTRKQCLRVSDLFISHAHMDHLAGFDRLFRASLGMHRGLRIYGPPDIQKRIHAHLQGYTWNLVGPEDVYFEVSEADADTGRIRQWRIGPEDRYRKIHETGNVKNTGVFLREDDVRVEFRQMNHTTPSLGYALVLEERWRVDSERLKEAELAPGPWVGDLIQAAQTRASDTQTLRIGGTDHPVGDLREQLLDLEPAWRTVYVTDTQGGTETTQAVLQLAENADLFYCEAVFIQTDADRAKRTHHLTARQCGILAQKAAVKALKTFHHSRRYPDSEQLLAEVRQEFPAAE